MHPALDHLTATQAASDICAGKYTSVELVTAALTRAKARPELNAFITLDETGAMEAARAYDAARARGEPCKPLGGVPIAIKDNIEVAGLPATAGTPAPPESGPRSQSPRPLPPLRPNPGKRRHPYPAPIILCLVFLCVSASLR